MSKTSRSWAPDDNDHLIYKWVIFDGETQQEVATRLKISQPTVCRVIQRYERWQAHAAPREGGRLDHDERLRVQRWLTYERNEKILASCLRIAADLEGFIDASRSTLQHEGGDPSNEMIVRTEHTRVDRTGTVARYLRLAFRINMEQLKLAEREPLPQLPPLTAAEIAAEEAQATHTTAMLEHGKNAPSGYWPPRDEPAQPEPVGRASGRPSEMEVEESGVGQSVTDLPTIDQPTTAQQPDRPEARPTMDLNKLNNIQPAYSDEIAASTSETCTCSADSSAEKTPCTGCTAPAAEPEWQAANSSGGAWTAPFPALAAPAG